LWQTLSTDRGVKLSMNGNCRAKYRVRLAGALALAGSLMPLSVVADDGELTPQLRIRQQQSRFQLMLEQVQERARRRGEALRTVPATGVAASTPVNLGNWTESMRLLPVPASDPVSPAIAPEAIRRWHAGQAYERDQQRILDRRQQRRALVVGARSGGPLGVDFGTKRRELVRYNVQSQRQSLQRKLRR